MLTGKFQGKKPFPVSNYAYTYILYTYRCKNHRTFCSGICDRSGDAERILLGCG